MVSVRAGSAVGATDVDAILNSVREDDDDINPRCHFNSVSNIHEDDGSHLSSSCSDVDMGLTLNFSTRESPFAMLTVVVRQQQHITFVVDASIRIDSHGSGADAVGGGLLFDLAMTQFSCRPIVTSFEVF